MIIKSIEIEKFRAFKNVSFCLGKRITAISGRNATQKTTVLGMIGQPFTISKNHPMYGCKTIDGYNFRSQFKEKFKISETHDIIGEHKWKLNLNPRVYEKGYFSIESIARIQKDKKPTLRFWNAESRASGAGYVQLPVYFLSLSRLYPIGESGRTQSFKIELTKEEEKYCIDKYREILAIQAIPTAPSGEPESSSVGVEKGTSSRTFCGVSDSIHDIFANSAGEGDITKIILAMLSFKRLKDKYGNDYKGGILLIDELDATLYGFSQKKLVDYLWEASKEFGVQVIFTTHSPIVLKQVNKYQREEWQRKGQGLSFDAYESAIVYLQPGYGQRGERIILPKNIASSRELNIALNDINLSISTDRTKLSVYCEDARAISFVRYILSKRLGVNQDLYMNFVDINLSWTNYVQLCEKHVPEFRNNVVILDGDVKGESGFAARKKVLEESKNFLILPLTIEKDLFFELKNPMAFNDFQSRFSNVPALNYDICFCDWPKPPEEYKTVDFKHWFEHLENILGDQTILYAFWYDQHREECDKFVDDFIETFNLLANRMELDGLPVSETDPEQVAVPAAIPADQEIVQ